MNPHLTDERQRSAPSDPATWIDEHGDALYRYALRRVHDLAVAEELVQETLLSALQTMDTFDGRSRFRTWLIAILRHRIVDHFRAQSREGPPGREVLGGLEAWTDALFDERGIWRRKLASWSAWPADAPEASELARTLESCLAKLPAPVAELFLLSEQHEVPADRLAEEFGITRNNLWIRLYRARVSLRQCLHDNWFEERSR